MSSNPLFGAYPDVEYNAEAQKGLVGLYCTMGLYFIVLGLAGVVAFKKKSAAEGDTDVRKSRVELQAHYTATYPPFLIALTIFSTAFSGYTVVGVPQTTLDRGYFVLMFFAGTCAQSLAMLVLFPRLRRLGKARGYLSPLDFIADRYRSKPTMILATVAACVPQFIYLAVQLASFGETLNGLSRGLVSKFWGMLICSVFMLVMELFGGMHAVVISDIIQAIIMLVGFVILCVVLFQRYDVLSLGSDTCPVQTLSSALAVPNCRSPNATMPSGYNNWGKDEVPYGCLFKTEGVERTMLVHRPYEFGKMAGLPGGFMNGNYFWFVFNFLAFPLNPHLVQRMFLAEKDRDLLPVIKLLLFSPFVAMGPGLIAGIVLAANWPLWGGWTGCASAFASLGVALQQDGGTFVYGLISVLSCAALAAIMSSADSVILGVSNVINVSVFKDIVNPDASGQATVRLGQVISVVMCLISFGLAMFINGATFLNWLSVQNGLLFQIAPAVLLGLYTNVSPKAILSGLAVGMVVSFPLLYQMLFGSQAIKGLLGAYIAAPSLAAGLNFLTVALVNCCTDSLAAPGENAYADQLTTRFGHFGGESMLQLADITEYMKGHVEPNRAVLGLAALLLLFTVPMFPLEGFVGIMPLWAFFVLVVIFVDTGVLFWAAMTWKPLDGDQESEVGLVTI